MTPSKGEEEEEGIIREGTDIQEQEDQGQSSIKEYSSSALHRNKTDEVAELIDKLRKLSINDSAYMLLYFQITSHVLNMIPFLVALPTKSQGERNIITSPASTGTNTKPSTSSFNGMLDCYFCGEKGHGMR